MKTIVQMPVAARGSGFDALLPPPRPAPVPALDTPREAAQRDLLSMEDHLLEQATDLMRGGMHAMDLEPDADGQLPTVPPKEWVDEVGELRAQRLLRAARLGLMSKKEAPIAFDLARSAHASITKARAQERGAPLTMNAIFLTASPAKYAELEIETDDEP